MNEWTRKIQGAVEETLESFLPSKEQLPSSLHEAMRYAVLGGGKRFRSQLVFASGELFGASFLTLLHVASAVELLHAYSLVHDDMPAMDNDLLRRGKPSVHAKYGEATALLVGDALQAQAYTVLSFMDIGAQQIVKMVQILSRATGSLGMCGGQAIDLESVGKTLSHEALEKMDQLKTGALFEASLLLGAYSSRLLLSEEIQILKQYASALGLSYQITDDILDATGQTKTLGKTAGKDQKDNKPTYVSLLGLIEAKKLATHYANEAILSLAKYGDAALRLRQLANWVLIREN